MQLRGFKIFRNQNMQQYMGQNPFPMRGLERFMQKRGMSFPGMFPGGAFPGNNQQGMVQQGGNLGNTLNVQVPPEKKPGGIKGLLGKFTRKSE